METISGLTTDPTERLKVGEVIDEPDGTVKLLNERLRARKKELAPRIVKASSDVVYYRSEKQSHPSYFTRAYVSFNRDIRPRGRHGQWELVTDEAISIGGRVAIFEDSREVHVCVRREERDYPAEFAEVSGEKTVDEQLTILDAADSILDLIEAARAARFERGQAQ
jgi:hypothetical protein